MAHVNYEFKAKADNIQELEARLLSLAPEFRGEDQQTDTYFQVSRGRLKLRQGSIENALIHYERENRAGAKQSNVLLYQVAGAGDLLKEMLAKSLGIKAVVDKTRRIYFIDNVKFHFDDVSGLGSFVEVEAIDLSGDIGVERLRQQCEEYAQLFGLQADNYISNSYSDMIMAGADGGVASS